MNKTFFKIGEFNSNGTIVVSDPALKLGDNNKVLQIKAGRYDVYALAMIDTFMNEGNAIFGSILIKHQSQENINLESIKLIEELPFDSCLAGLFHPEFFKTGLKEKEYQKLIQTVFKEMPNCPLGDSVKRASSGWDKLVAVTKNFIVMSNPENKTFSLFQDENQVMIQCFEASDSDVFLPDLESMLKTREDYLRDSYVEREMEMFEQSRNTEFFDVSVKLFKNRLINHQNLTDEKTREILSERIKLYE